MPFARLMCCGAVALVFAGLARPLPLHGQDPQAGSSPQATFRSTATLVEVDAIILDRAGKFVPGLVADDLTLYEDGKPQAIQQFYMVTHSDGSATGQGRVAGPQPEERAHRVFVLLFDESHLANDSLMRVKTGAEEFIQSQIGPGDVGGVFVNGSMYRGRLTSDKNELIAAVRSVRPGFENRQSLLAPFREFPRIPGEIDASRIAEGARELVDQLGRQACVEDAFQCNFNGGLQAVENLIERKARLYVRQARVLTSQTMQNLQYVTKNLTRIPGRKTLVFLSEGFYVEDSRAELHTVAAQAARGGTAIYSIDGRGNINGSSPNMDVSKAELSRATTFDTGEDGPTILTGGTGGLRLRNIDDIGRALGLVARDTSTYYVVGYQPQNRVMDGKYRKIELKPRASGLQVRARTGYLAIPLPPLQMRQGGQPH